MQQQQQQDVLTASAVESIELDTSWIDKLSGPAAAAALFSCWAWQLPGSGSPEVLLLLYHRARQAKAAAKPSIEGLLLDLGLAAAGRAAAWHEGEQSAVNLERQEMTQ